MNPRIVPYMATTRNGRYRTAAFWVFWLIPLLLTGQLLSGCSSVNRTGKGAAIGAGAGAVLGGIIGKQKDEAGKGAIIGAVVGGTAGAIIGAQMDKQAEELEGDLDGVEIERVGEGIQLTFDSAILFDFNSSALRPNSVDNLRRLASSLQEYPNTDVVIAGHTDSTGPEDYNQELSEERALAAASQLLEAGVDPARLTSIGKGELEPATGNDTPAGRQANRRVEIAIFASEAYRQELEAREGETG